MIYRYHISKGDGVDELSIVSSRNITVERRPPALSTKMHWVHGHLRHTINRLTKVYETIVLRF